MAHSHDGSLSTVSVQLEFGVLVSMEGGRKTEKNSRSKDENQQQTQPTCDARSGNRTWRRALSPLHHPCSSSYTSHLCHIVFLTGQTSICSRSTPIQTHSSIQRISDSQRDSKPQLPKASRLS